MLQATVKLRSASPYSQSRPIRSPKETGERGDAYELRTWRERIHEDKNGEVYIPGNAIKNCLSDVAKYLAESVPGKGKATYTKHFEAGIMVIDPLKLGIKAANIEPEKLFVPSDGKRGGSKRVWKYFPLIPEWQAEATIVILDPVLTANPEKVEEYLGYAGKFIGLGRFRPRNNGYYGRFSIVEGSWVVAPVLS